MRNYLLLRLYGPLAAWGDTAVGEFRPSLTHPSRTAVLGLLAATLGIKRDQENALLALDQSALVAVRLDLPGEVLRDYHTIQVPPENRRCVYYTRADEMRAETLNTIVSQRDYRTDSGASVALQHSKDDNDALKKWQQALRNPALLPYLGRKACPLAMPMDPTIICAAGLETAFAKYPDCVTQLAKLSDKTLPQGEHISYYWEGKDAELKSEMSYQRRDRLHSRNRWQFTPRTEHQAAKSRRPSSKSEKEH